MEESAHWSDDATGPAVGESNVRFSVLVPAYQAARTVRRAVSSVLEQTLPAHQVIVCDDGSTDDIDGALAPYLERIHLVRQENRGLSAARNRALSDATGDWIVLLDADDEFLPTRLERLAERLHAERDLDIVTTDALIRRPGIADVRYYDLHSWASDDQVLSIVRGNFVFVAAAIRRSRLVEVGGFREGLAQDSEYATWVDLILSGSTASLVNEPLAIYHQDGGSQLSSNRVSTYRMLLEILHEMEGTRDAGFDSVVRERQAEVQRLLSVAEGVSAVRRRDRRVIWLAATDRRLPVGMRARFAAATVAPGVAARRLAGGLSLGASRA